MSVHGQKITILAYNIKSLYVLVCSFLPINIILCILVFKMFFVYFIHSEYFSISIAYSLHLFSCLIEN